MRLTSMRRYNKNCVGLFTCETVHMETISGKYVLIAGATGGIGSALIPLMLSSGARVFVTGRNEGRLQDLCVQHRIPAEQSFAADLSDAGQVAELADRFFRAFPRIDILINVSGIGIIRPFESLSADDFMRSVNANLVAPFLLLKSFLPSMKTEKKGLVIQVPGVLGKVPMAGAAAYCASKYGLVGMMQSIREEIKRTDIRITNVFMGGVDSPFWDEIDLRVQRDKMIQASEAARAIWFLCQQPGSGVISELVLQPFNHQAI